LRRMARGTRVAQPTAAWRVPARARRPVRPPPGRASGAWRWQRGAADRSPRSDWASCAARQRIHRPGTATPPPAEGVRLQWDEVPEAVRRAFEDWAGSPVVSAVSQPSGFSPGVAARVRLADGRGVFVKAIGPKPNPDSPTFHRMEARIASAL